MHLHRKSLLTKKEIVVLYLVGDGLSNQEICHVLQLSDSTVRTHLRHIFSKLGARSRSHAVSLASKQNILEPK